MIVRFTRQALSDIEQVGGYIEQDSPAAAHAVLSRIRTAIEGLAQFPERGRSGRVAGTRELVIPNLPFVVAYRVEPSQVVVLAILHAARKWPISFRDKPE